jgi:hypothetical protein
MRTLKRWPSRAALGGAPALPEPPRQQEVHDMEDGRATRNDQ